MTVPSLVSRMAASLTTGGIYLFLVVLIGGCTFATCPVQDYLVFAGGIDREFAHKVETLLAFGLPLFVVLADATYHRATVGMRRNRLVFQDREGLPLGVSHCLFRLLVGTVALPLLPFSICTALADERHRTVADLLCGTWVVRQQETERARANRAAEHRAES